MIKLDREVGNVGGGWEGEGYRPVAVEVEWLTVSADPGRLGGLLALAMKRSGLTLAQLSRRLGRSDPTVQQYLTGRRARPGLRVFQNWVEACGGRVLVELPVSAGRDGSKRGRPYVGGA